MIRTLKTWARGIKRQLLALSLAYRDPRTPWYAKAWTALVLAYAFSPIDLIPDFIPVLGLLDDAILLPLGIMVALRLIPPAVMTQAQDQARALEGQQRPTSLIGAIVIVLVWLVAAVLVGRWAWGQLQG